MGFCGRRKVVHERNGFGDADTIGYSCCSPGAGLRDCLKNRGVGFIARLGSTERSPPSFSRRLRTHPCAICAVAASSYLITDNTSEIALTSLPEASGNPFQAAKLWTFTPRLRPAGAGLRPAGAGLRPAGAGLRKHALHIYRALTAHDKTRLTGRVFLLKADLRVSGHSN